VSIILLFSDQSELEFAQWLTSEIGLAVIPMSAFYHKKNESGIIRFCFAKKNVPLKNAIDRLQKI
jgi:methionine aminotransferase